MKRLAVLRHAKSSWADASQDDFDRPLNERGWKAARRLGREMIRWKMRFDCGVASPAARARETLDGVAQGCGELQFPVRFEPKAYLADPDTLLELIRELAGEAERVLLVGHNPGLQQLVVELSQDDPAGLRKRVIDKFPTAALAVIDLDVAGWREVSPGRGRLCELILAKELD